MATVDLLIGIGADYRGKTAFKKADKDILGLNAGVKKLAKAYIGLAGAQKAFAYASSSVKAFVQDDKAARQLSKTVGNLGLAYEATNVENFIQGLEKTYHINDDFLRPSFAKLIQVTQSYTKSKELLTTAINASAGAGVDLTTTVQDLSQAYVGNLRGLRKYNLGLTQAELSTMSFQQIQDKLNATFTGQGALAADTYAGKMDALAIASNNAKEIIGKGLVDAISTAFGGGEIDKATANMEKMAGYAADFTRAIGTSLKYSGASLIGNIFGALSKKKAELATKDRKYDPMSGNTPGLSKAAITMAQNRAKADALSAKRQKELAAATVKLAKAQKEATALAKAKAVLDKASAVFNMDLIQNTAALQGKLTDDETLRLKLQQAILLGNSDAAGKLAQELLASQEAAMKLAYSNPLGNWSDAFKSAIDALKQLQDELAKLGAQKMPFWWMGNTTDPTAAGYTDPSGVGVPPVNYGYTDAAPSFTYNQGNPLSDVNVTVTMNPDAAKLFITDVVVGNSANGNQNSLTRVTTPWMI
jgi:hypothetical protein